jgi:hypothetical protein
VHKKVHPFATMPIKRSHRSLAAKEEQILGLPCVLVPPWVSAAAASMLSDCQRRSHTEMAWVRNRVGRCGSALFVINDPINNIHIAKHHDVGSRGAAGQIRLWHPT